jgi:hypothetical protein
MNHKTDHRGVQAERQAIPAWLPATVIGVAALALSFTAEAGSRNSARAAGVFPPWWSQSAALAAAGQAGDITAVGALPFVVIIRSAHGPAAPRLRAAGALLSLNAGLAGLCGA